MSSRSKAPGALMAAETEEAAEVFIRNAERDVSMLPGVRALRDCSVYFTVARGSSDAVANMLAYEAMRVFRRPVTSLPPSVFSVFGGLVVENAGGIFISQSGESADLVRSCEGLAKAGAATLAITNAPNSPLAGAAGAVLDIAAGPERAVPATKSVIGSLGAGVALLRAAAGGPETGRDAMTAGGHARFDHHDEMVAALVAASHIYVVGRGAGFGASIETALKLKECAALHAEAYSASEVLHGPLQLVSRPMVVLVLDTGEAGTRDSLDTAEARFRAAGSRVFRLDLAGLGTSGATGIAAAAILLAGVYRMVLDCGLQAGFDPDAPAALSKVTQTI